MRITAPALLIVLIMSLLTLPASAAASAASDGVDALNELRTWAGLGAVTLDPTLTAGCDAHVGWMATNRMLAHAETPGTPGYSAAGSDTGLNSVLASSRPFSPMATIDTVPWLRGAPIHLFQMLHPGLVRSGYAWNDIYSCLVVKDIASYPDVDVFDASRGRDKVLLWPPDGAGNLPPTEDASTETPNPYTLVGLPANHRSGPFILVMANGFGAVPSCAGVRFLSATITSADGMSVPVRFWDDAKERARLKVAAHQCTAPSGGGWVLAEQPLDPSTPYTVSVTLVGIGSTGPAKTSTREWKIETGTDASAASGLPIAAGDVARPTVRVTRARLVRRASTTAWQLRLTAKDASVMTCTARIIGRSRRCVVRRGRIDLVGVRRGTVRRGPWRVVVRDAAGNRTVKFGSMR